jgi:hypothetical protein
MRSRAGTHPRRRGTRSSRDQTESPFASILGALVARVPGARAAALVDLQGETVDYAGRGAPFDLRLAAAHWRLVLDEAQAQTSLPSLTWFAVRAARGSYLVYALPDGYALVILLTRAAGFVGWHRAVATCARALGEEAGWRWPGTASAAWFPVEVVSDERHRPRSVRIAGRLRSLEILGALVRHAHREAGEGPDSVAPRERGWRVRFASGIEATLVREPGGVWYTDEPFEAAVAPRSSRKSS